VIASTADPAFRLATASDAELLLDLMHSYYAFDGHGFDRDKARTALLGLLRDERFGRAWLVLDGSQTAGYAVLCFGYSLEWLGRDAFVDELFLKEQYRGCGWGRQTLAYLEDAARKDGIRALHLAVTATNASARNLYTQVGFHQHTSTFHSKWIAQDGTKPEGRNGY